MLTNGLKRFALLPLTLSLAFCGGNRQGNSPAAYRADLEYLKALHESGRSPDPQATMFLVSQFQNSRQIESGARFFERRIREGSTLPDQTKALYLAAQGLLRVSHAPQVSLLSRRGWVQDSIQMLEDAKRLSSGDSFYVRWMAGVVYARLPKSFDRSARAVEELEWCEKHIDQAPHPGWLREIYFGLALAKRTAGDEQSAKQYLDRSGYRDYDVSLTLTTPYAVAAEAGFTFSAPRLIQVVPGKVFTLSGFDFSELYFVLSGDRKQLIAIDAGTTPAGIEAGLKRLAQEIGALPPVTTVFVTHSHWDHIGGHTHLRKANPQVRFYTHERWREEMALITAGEPAYQYFFGKRFSRELVTGFRPDTTIAARTKVTVGGTEFELIPATGSETNDALLIRLPEHGIVFAGDAIMPYFGAPFIEEGSVEGLLEVIDLLGSLDVKTLLLGHEPLNRMFESVGRLRRLRPALDQLQKQALGAIRSGKARADVQQTNFIGTGIKEQPDLQLPYLLLRENAINRLHDQQTGYWQAQRAGLDHLSSRELGAILTKYLRVTDKELISAVEEMVASGDYELAATTLLWAEAAVSNNPKLETLRQATFNGLRERFQELSPFKFIVYSETIGREIPPVR